MEIDFLWIKIHTDTASATLLMWRTMKKIQWYEISFVFQHVGYIRYIVMVEFEHWIICLSRLFLFSQSFAIDGIGRAYRCFEPCEKSYVGENFHIYVMDSHYSAIHIFGRCCCYFIFSQFFIAIEKNKRKKNGSERWWCWFFTQFI